MKVCVFVDFWSGFLGSPDYLRSAEMTEVMMNTPSMEEIGLNPRKDGLSYQVSSVLGSLRLLWSLVTLAGVGGRCGSVSQCHLEQLCDLGKVPSCQ